MSTDEKSELEEEIQKQSGWVMPGLYHGSRRVRAKLDHIGSYWLISDDENDLIKAIGSNRVTHSGVNHVDLKNQYGLTITNEIAPVKVVCNKHGDLEVIRTDDWGQGATAYVDDRDFFEKVGIASYRDILFLLLIMPFCLATLISEKLSTRANNIVLGMLFLFGLLSPLFSPSGIVSEFNVSGWPKHGLGILLLYLITAILPFFQNGPGANPLTR